MQRQASRGHSCSRAKARSTAWAHEPLSARARATIQADVDNLYAQLCGLVAANRRLTPEAVRGTNATVYRGELAIRAGLADRLGTLDLAIAEMAAELDHAISTPRPTINSTPKRRPSMTTNESKSIERDLNDPTAVPAAQAETKDPKTAPAPAEPPAPEMPSVPPLETALADKLRAEFGEIAAIATQAARLGVTVDAADAMRKGISADDLRRSVLDALAARAEATSVIAAAPSTPFAGDSPIVRRAKERAAAAAR